MIKPIKLPSQKFLRECLRYNRRTGKLFWRKRPLSHFVSEGMRRRWNNRYAGLEAFTQKTDEGYLRGAIYKRTYLAHRVIWKWVTGEEPPPILDHIGRDESDNRWGNIRPATQVQNCMNREHRGISFDADQGKWRARITVDRKRIHLGWFATEKQAKIVRDAEVRNAYEEFAPCN